MKSFGDQLNQFLNILSWNRRFLHASKNTILIGVVVSLGLSLVGYSTINAQLWSVYDRWLEVHETGSAELKDLSPWRNDMSMAWREDMILYDTSGVALQFYKPMSWLWVPKPHAVFPHWGIWGLIAALGVLWLICIAVPWLAYRYSASGKWTGLDASVIPCPERERIRNRSVLLMLCLLPLFFVASWYFSYDRVHSSISWETNQPRLFRLLFDSFTPRLREWVMVYAIMAIGLFSLCWIRFQRHMHSIPHDRVVEHRECCPCRKCRYPFDRSMQRCPECGTNWFAHHPAKAVMHRWHRTARLGSVLLVVTLLASTIWGVSSRDRRYKLWAWLTLRDDIFLWQDLILKPGKPVELRWGPHTLRLVGVVHQETGAIAYTIDGGGLNWLGQQESIEVDAKPVVPPGWGYVEYYLNGERDHPTGTHFYVHIMLTPSEFIAYQPEHTPARLRAWADEVKANYTVLKHELPDATQSSLPVRNTPDASSD